MSPSNDTCTADGDIYIDTEAIAFYQCAAGEWIFFGPAAVPTPAPPEGPVASDSPAPDAPEEPATDAPAEG